MKSQRHAPNDKAASRKFELQETQATREYRARMFRQYVITGMIATGLVFMVLGIPGSLTVVLGGGSLLLGHSVTSKFRG